MWMAATTSSVDVDGRHFRLENAIRANWAAFLMTVGRASSKRVSIGCQRQPRVGSGTSISPPWPATQLEMSEGVGHGSGGGLRSA